MDTIQTFGNRCFSGRPTPISAKPVPISKPEKVNLKFGKIRVTVQNAKTVRVAQDGMSMVIMLDELTSSSDDGQK